VHHVPARLLPLSPLSLLAIDHKVFKYTVFSLIFACPKIREIGGPYFARLLKFSKKIWMDTTALTDSRNKTFLYVFFSISSQYYLVSHHEETLFNFLI